MPHWRLSNSSPKGCLLPKSSPGPMERHQMLTHLANRQTQMNLPSSRRLSRQEFIHSVNDLLGLDWDLSEALPTGKGTFLFDSDRRILPTEPWMAAVFHVTDELLNRAFPSEGVSCGADLDACGTAMTATTFTPVPPRKASCFRDLKPITATATPFFTMTLSLP